MSTYIAFLRGINVSGRNKLPMGELVALFKEAGVESVKTCINSGNVVFTSRSKALGRLAADIAAAVKRKYGFEPGIQILTLKELQAAMAANPFAEAAAQPESLHLGFLAEKPTSPDLAKLESFRKENERFSLIGNVFYLHAPDGVGRSKLAAGSERLLGVGLTDRNWRTVCRVWEMAQQMQA